MLRFFFNSWEHQCLLSYTAFCLAQTRYPHTTAPLLQQPSRLVSSRSPLPKAACFGLPSTHGSVRYKRGKDRGLDGMYTEVLSKSAAACR